MKPIAALVLAAAVSAVQAAPAAPPLPQPEKAPSQEKAPEPEKKVGSSADENPYAATFAAEGTGLDTFLQMHNRRGLRIELDLDKKTLELWVSPRAGESLDYRDRNFSNRDDHTRVFDRIALPRLPERRDLLRCDYDPFHSVLHYRDQVLHVATLFDRPVVLVWFEGPGTIDLKSDKQDRPGARTETLFESRTPTAAARSASPRRSRPARAASSTSATSTWAAARMRAPSWGRAGDRHSRPSSTTSRWPSAARRPPPEPFAPWPRPTRRPRPRSRGAGCGCAGARRCSACSTSTGACCCRCRTSRARSAPRSSTSTT